MLCFKVLKMLMLLTVSSALVRIFEKQEILTSSWIPLNIEQNVR